MAGDEVVAVPL